MKRIRKILKYIIQLEFIPSASHFLFESETFLRLKPLKVFLDVVDPNKVKKIIDIGGANGSVETSIGRKDITIYDINEAMLTIAEENSLKCLRGKQGENINCDDNSYDWAISIHTYEHIKKQEREKFLLEMIRISKEGVYLNFPAGKYAEKLCVNYIDALDKNIKERNHWTLDHIDKGLPDENELNEILSKQNKFNYEIKTVRNFKSENHYWCKIRAANSFLIYYLLSPINSVMKYINYRKAPGVEFILIASKNQELNQIVLSNIK